MLPSRTAAGIPPALNARATASAWATVQQKANPRRPAASSCMSPIAAAVTGSRIMVSAAALAL
jgi:hypothetical protein